MPKRYRILLLLALLLYCGSLAFARLLDFSFIGLNDAMTVGLVQNADDLRSYGAVLTTRFSPGLTARVEAAGLTMRSSVTDSSGSRYDELIVETGWTHTLSFPGKSYDMTYELSALLGLTLAGNLGFQTIQNTWHEMNGIPLVFLPYCQDDSIGLYPRISQSQRLRTHFPVPWFSRASFDLALEQRFDYSVGYGFDLALETSIGQRVSSSQNLSLGLGFAYSGAFDEVLLHEMIALSESGIYLHLNGRMGLVDLLFRAYLSSGRGWGGIGFRFGENIESEADLPQNYALSLSLTVPEKAMTLSVVYHLGDYLSLFFTNSFDDYILDITVNMRQNISWWKGGIRYSIGRVHNWIVSPFVSMASGVRRISVFKNDSVSAERVREFDSITPLVNTEIGCLVFSDSRFQMQGVSYAIECAAGFSYSPSAHLIDAVQTYSLEYVQTLEWYVRIGISMGSAL